MNGISLRNLHPLNHSQAYLLTIRLRFSPGSVCLGDGWPSLQHPGTSVDSTAFGSEPGRRDGTGLPPHSAHPRPGVRMSAGAASRDERSKGGRLEEKGIFKEYHSEEKVYQIRLTLTRYREMCVILCLV